MDIAPRPIADHLRSLNRRRFFGGAGLGLGTAALAMLLGEDASRGAEDGPGSLPGLPHFAPKAKRVIYLMQGGARRTSTCSTTSPTWRSVEARSCPSRSTRGSGSPR